MFRAFSWYIRYNLEYLVHNNTARKTIFSFSRRPEKMVFPKKSRWNMIFLVLSRKIMFLFPENMILHLRRKMKDDLSQKNTWKYDFFFKLSEKMVFSKRGRAGTWSPLYYLERWYFFPKTWYFFLGRKVRGKLFQEIHGNMKFSVYTYRCYKRGAMPLCQKKSNMILYRKNTPEGDWRSRLTF